MQFLNATASLPQSVDPNKWKTKSWSHDKKVEWVRSPACERRCNERVQEPPARARELLRELREPPVFWLALRKHLNEQDATYILAVLAEHTGWKEVKHSRNERLRKEYLTLFDECRFFDPSWKHTAMTERQQTQASGQ